LGFFGCVHIGAMIDGGGLSLGSVPSLGD
jgi:hypothetical protein